MIFFYSELLHAHYHGGYGYMLNKHTTLLDSILNALSDHFNKATLLAVRCLEGERFHEVLLLEQIASIQTIIYILKYTQILQSDIHEILIACSNILTKFNESTDLTEVEYCELNFNQSDCGIIPGDPHNINRQNISQLHSILCTFMHDLSVIASHASRTEGNVC